MLRCQAERPSKWTSTMLRHTRHTTYGITSSSVPNTGTTCFAIVRQKDSRSYADRVPAILEYPFNLWKWCPTTCICSFLQDLRYQYHSSFAVRKDIPRISCGRNSHTCGDIRHYGHDHTSWGHRTYIGKDRGELYRTSKYKFQRPFISRLKPGRILGLIS